MSFRETVEDGCQPNMELVKRDDVSLVALLARSVHDAGALIQSKLAVCLFENLFDLGFKKNNFLQLNVFKRIVLSYH